MLHLQFNAIFVSLSFHLSFFCFSSSVFSPTTFYFFNLFSLSFFSESYLTLPFHIGSHGRGELERQKTISQEKKKRIDAVRHVYSEKPSHRNLLRLFTTVAQMIP
ncbi:hypothetical protein, unlikely [Trypanosoma brucei gambiense DAL972]|uniref:Uncharacterized protein n=1 Tax=Trypanosoma brucei gambiense (strain MHOM/CI/86/DAL972) TaxID=679716 RepID=D0A8R5_TRYB9|nr:hypothetical protein, unlikely [Trypanosoma brucei gambiense DAL972]CBH18066.1 hypothetical protein, unlikely [Trypanosoma brucei gambiense DAL972]|eukprot:XP_011780330.1 hypothetical protein, unlikely [Trypanosoma brucei gambiense DAL972]